MATAQTPSRGEIWLVNFNPVVGDEIGKLRPAVVMIVASVGRLALRIVVPVTDWKPVYGAYPWMVKLHADPMTGLTKPSVADAFQTKSTSLDRFRRRIGSISANTADDIAVSIAICVGLPATEAQAENSP